MSRLSEKVALITGGAGYIGSKLATKLVNLNFEVTVIDILKFSKNSLNHLFYKKNFPDETTGDHIPFFRNRSVGSCTGQHALAWRSSADVRYRALCKHMAQAGREAQP